MSTTTDPAMPTGPYPWWARRWEVIFQDATGTVVAARAFTEAGAWRALSWWECACAGQGHPIEMTVRRRP